MTPHQRFALAWLSAAAVAAVVVTLAGEAALSAFSDPAVTVDAGR